MNEDAVWHQLDMQSGFSTLKSVYPETAAVLAMAFSHPADQGKRYVLIWTDTEQQQGNNVQTKNKKAIGLKKRQ